MARRKKQKGEEGGPAWLITFSDLMTLLLTFFVLLVSMAVIDERAKKEVLGSVSKRFGPGRSITNPTAKTNKETSLYTPGRMEDAKEEDLEPLRDMVFDEQDKDLDFKENMYVQVLSINSEVLFERGGWELSRKGVQLLDRIVPYLQEVRYPVLVAGYTSVRREEEGGAYTPDFDTTKVDPSWMLSFRRSHAVYRHFTGRGIPEARLMLEGYGRFHPRYSNETPEGRMKNRRVDLILDKRNLAWIEKVEQVRQKEPDVPREYFYQGFSFDLTMPGENRPER